MKTDAQPQLSSVERTVWMESLPEISKEMMDSLHFLIYLPIDKGVMMRQINQNYRDCASLLDLLDGVPLPGPEDSGILELRTAIQYMLEEVLDHVESYYDKYLDGEVLVPLIRLRRAGEDIRNLMLLIQAGFRKHEIEEGLVAEVLDCMQSVLKLKRLSQGTLKFIHTLQLKILEFLKREPLGKDRATERLAALLVEEDYNHMGFISWYQQWILTRLAEGCTSSEAYNLLSKYRWKFKKTPYKKGKVLKYTKQCKRCHAILYDFVIAQRATRQPEQPRPQQSYTAGSSVPPVAAEYKIRFLLSVEALAYLTKLMLEANMIEAGVKTELFAAIVRTYDTAATAGTGISPGSFSTKFKNVTDGTAANVRAVLKKMIGLIDEEFD